MRTCSRYTPSGKLMHVPALRQVMDILMYLNQRRRRLVRHGHRGGNSQVSCRFTLPQEIQATFTGVMSGNVIMIKAAS